MNIIMSSFVMLDAALEWRSIDLWFFAAIAILVTLVVSLVPARKPSPRSLVQSLIIRGTLVGIIGVFLLSPVLIETRVGIPIKSRAVYLLDRNLRNTAEAERFLEKQRMNQGELLMFKPQEAVRQTLRTIEDSQVQVNSIHVLTEPVIAASLQPLLDAAAISYQLDAVEKNVASVLKRAESVGAGEASTLTSWRSEIGLQIHSPASCLNETPLPIQVTLSDSADVISLNVLDSERTLVWQSNTLMDLTLPALSSGSYTLELENTSEETTFSRSLRVVEPEHIVVLTQSRTQVSIWQALMPQFQVFGLQTNLTGNDEPWPFAAARAIVLPLEERQILSERLVAAVLRYVQQGGLLITTGMSHGSRRAGSPPPNIEPLLAAALVEPPEPQPEIKEDEKDEPDPEPKPSSGLLELPKVSALFLVDHSGSLLVGKRWQHCKAAINGAYEKIEDYDRAGLAVFTDKFDWDTAGGITNIDRRTRSRIRRFLDNNPPRNADTDIYGAVRRGLKELKQERAAVRLLVVVSDGIEGRFGGAKHDYRTLRRAAIDDDIIIATIRVGALEGHPNEKSADELMVALATHKDYASAISDDYGETLLPRIMLRYVSIAYDEHQRLEDAKKDESKDDPEQESDPEQREPDPPIVKDEFIAGDTVLSLGAWPSSFPFPIDSVLQPIAGAVAELSLHAGSRELARREASHGVNESPAIALRPIGEGFSLFISAPLDARHAGSWLLDTSSSGALLDVAIRSLAQPRISSLAHVLELSQQGSMLALSSGRRLSSDASLVFRDNYGTELRVAAIARGRTLHEIPATAARAEVLSASKVLAATQLTPPSNTLSKLIAKESNTLPLSLSLPAGSWQGQGTPIAETPGVVREERIPHRFTLLAVILVVGILPFERWIRRT